MIVKENNDEVVSYLSDASNIAGGAAEAVYFPEHSDEVARILQQCNVSGTPITVSGARTGLAGGSVPFGGVALSMARLNRIVSIDPVKFRAVVQPGVILGDFQQEVERQGLLYPPDPTERTCVIGGSVATNASGARTFKYGSTRSYVERLEVVLAGGRQLSIKRGETFANGRRISLKTVEDDSIEFELPSYIMPETSKHAAGYYVKPDMDAIDLFIGSEGTLGVITEIELRLIPLPERLFSGIIFFPNETSTLAFVDEARERSRHAMQAERANDDTELSARGLEYVDYNALEFIRTQFPTIPENAFGGAVWFEQETTEENEERLLGEWYKLMERHDACTDESWFAIGLEDQRKMRDFRHAVPSSVYEYITEHGQTKLGTDMAVPDGSLPDLLAFYRAQFREHELRNVTWGHIGNNHLHANILVEHPEQLQLAQKVYGLFVEKALALGGTVSAEHGVGKLKKKYLAEMFGAKGIGEMRALKKTLDPNCILGRGTMFDC